MAADEIGFLPDRLNRPPSVFLGLTDSELRLLGLANLSVWVPVCVLAGALVGGASLGLGAGMAATIGGVWVSGRVLRRMKRGKPAGYHADRASAWLQDHGIGRRTMLRESVVWDIRRYRPVEGR